MLYSNSRPLRVLTRDSEITSESWQGETPVEIIHAPGWHDPSAYQPYMQGIDVLHSQVFTREMAEAADSLKFIQAAGAGLERIDFSAVPKGCQVAIVFEHENAIAEWVIMAMIALNRETIRAHRDVLEATWDMHVTRGRIPRPELRNQTLGVVGLGHIGKRAAGFARTFGMRVIAATRTVPSEEDRLRMGLDFVTDMGGLGRVLGESDFVLLSLPLTEETRGLMGAREFAQMKYDGHLINVSRAGLVDEQALFDALSTKAIKGAALDVWFNEPRNAEDRPKPSNLPFWELDNVLMSPHSATITREMIQGRTAFAMRNIDRFARGEPVENVVYVG